jgi:hypothetical protein
MMKSKWMIIFFLILSIAIAACGCLAGKTSQKSTSTLSTTKTVVSSSSEKEAETTSGTTAVATTAAPSLEKGSEAFQNLLTTAIPVFSDTFVDKTHAPDTISSAYYGQSVTSTRNISFTDGEVGNGVHLDNYDSYIGYPAGIVKASEGTIRFAYRPDADLFQSYNERQDVWRDYSSYTPPFVGFFIDTVGWNAAFTGGYTVCLFFSPADSRYSSISFGTWSGGGWSNTSAELTSTIPWDSSKWYDIVIAYSKTKGKLAVYIDSFLAGEAAYNTSLSETEGFFIGQGPWKTGEEYWPYGPHALKGTYSNLRIYDQALMD